MQDGHYPSGTSTDVGPHFFVRPRALLRVNRGPRRRAAAPRLSAWVPLEMAALLIMGMLALVLALLPVKN